jgi:hypothetical protein
VSERASTALLALGALLLFFVVMFGGRAGGISEGGPARPTSVETAGNGYSSARRWLEREGIRVVSLREPFEALARLAPAGRDGASLLVLTLPGAGPIQTRELLPLDRWLRDGNTLLVVAALSDAPDWSAASAGADAFDLKAVTGLEFESLPQRRARIAVEGQRAGRGDRRAAVPRVGEPGVGPDAGGRAGSRGESRLLARPAQAVAEPVRREGLLEGRLEGLLDGVESLVAESDFRTTPWAVRMPYDGLVLELARERESGEGVLWSRALGGGHIVVAAYGSLLSNRAVARGDNARLLANLVATAVGPRGVVLFDDGHQGLSPSYDPQQLFGDRRLHLTIALLIGFWLLWVLGPRGCARRATPNPRPGPRTCCVPPAASSRGCCRPRRRRGGSASTSSRGCSGASTAARAPPRNRACGNHHGTGWRATPRSPQATWRSSATGTGRPAKVAACRSRACTISSSLSTGRWHERRDA